MLTRRLGYRYYLLTVLAIVYAFNATDTWAIGMCLQSIKRDLQLSDTELGFLSGIAFFFFYALFGIPIGRWSDCGNRVTILSVTRMLWVAFVILTGRATSFAQLLLFRMGAGVGEAGCLPPAYSLISDYFSREERPEAIGLFLIGAPFSTLLGYMGVGWLLEFYDWRSAFGVIGFSGVVLAPLAWATLREPRKRQGRAAVEIKRVRDDQESFLPAIGISAPPSMLTTFRLLCGNATYRNLTAAMVVNSMFAAGIFQWLPAYFMRSFGLKSGELGTWLALVYALPGMIGQFAGGRLASRWAGGKEQLQLVTTALINCCLGILLPLVYLSHSHYVAFGLLGLLIMIGSLENAPILSAMQLVVPSRMVGMSLMLACFFATLIGSGLGPIAVGALSDSLRPIFGRNSLRYALLFMSPWYLWGAWHLLRASRSVIGDIEARAREPEERVAGPDVGSKMDARY